MTTLGHPAVGVQFTETMRGYFSTRERNDYQAGFDGGQEDGSPFEFTLTVTIDDVDRLIEDQSYPGRMVGTVTAPALSPQSLRVADGLFNLFVKDPEQVATRKMTYRMQMTAPDGKSYFLDGFKRVHDDFGFDMWKDTTTLFITIYEGNNDRGAIVGRGIVHVKPADFQDQLASMRAVNAPDPIAGGAALARFGAFFNGVLQEIYGGVFSKPVVFDVDGPSRKRRPLRCGEPVVHFFKTSDGLTLRLSRFRGGDKGPVVLVPGFGTSSLAFTIDTVDTNLPEFLFERGYDVWVFDYRASPALASAITSFTLDDIALHDYPAMVAKVREETGTASIQIMAHCVGSLTFQMAQAMGLEGVRSAVCSALTLHSESPTLNQIKSALRLPNLLAMLRVDTLTTDTGGECGWFDAWLDKALHLYPASQKPSSPTARRILFMYGEVFDENKLNQATYDALREMFGPGNMTSFMHLARMVNAGHIVNAEGGDVYLPRADRLKLPIAFLHGANNRLFLPAGSEKTFRFLCERNGPQWYARHVLPDYAHMDCFIGKDAARNVYPTVVAELDRYN